jgi:glycosyltransferase involved in cell wall biosynthesis
MRICQVGTGFTSIPPQLSAATEEVVYNLCKGLIPLGCDVHIVDIIDKKRMTTDLTIHEVPCFSFLKTTRSNSLNLIAKRLSFSFFSAIELQRLKHDFDVVHFHNQFPASMFQLFSIQSSKKVPRTVYTLHNGIWGLPDSEMPRDVRIKFVLEVEAMKRADKVVAVSETLRRNITKRLSLKPSSIVVIPNGVDTNLFHPNRATPPSLRRELAPDGERIVLCVGRICRNKGQKTLVDAIPKIAQENPSVRFVFVGPIDDTKYFKNISDTINSQSLGKYCAFTGDVSPNLIPNYLAMADVFVLPSITEGLPLTLLQAMSSGRAIVASAIPQNMEVAKQGDEIIFVNPLNVEEISNAIAHLLSDEPEMKKLGKKARRTALRYFDWKTIAKKTLRLYENVTNAR